MDVDYPPQAQEFRSRVKAVLGEHLPPGWTGMGGVPLDEREEFRRQWRRTLGEHQMLAVSWPTQYGGAGLTLLEQVVLAEEFALAGAPQGSENDSFGIGMLGNTLIHLGTEEQKAHYLPRILSGEQRWCQGYSEPEAGSDLAGIRTSAVLDGDEWVINGQKTWTSAGHLADHIFVLARTDPAAPKHRGTSFFVLDMKSPGIQIQPLVNMLGDHSFNQVYFDNVRVPRANLIGEENRGWYVGATTLDFERSGIGNAVSQRQAVEELVKFARQGGEKSTLARNPALKAELSDRLIEANVAKMLSYRVISMQDRGQIPNYEASVSKNFRSETSQRVARTGMKVIGMYGLLRKEPKWAPLNGRLSHMYLSSVPATIAAGTSEINRNVIATRGLGLPRG